MTFEYLSDSVIFSAKNALRSQDLQHRRIAKALSGDQEQTIAALLLLERARAAVEKARADRVQNVTVQGIVQYDNSIALVDGAVQVTMPVPVFNRNQGNIREAEGTLIESSHAYRRLELNLRAKLALVYERYSTAQSQVEEYEKEILPAARESLDLTLSAYREGQLGFVNLLTAQRTYFQTSIAYQGALRELWLAIYEMDGLLLVEKP